MMMSEDQKDWEQEIQHLKEQMRKQKQEIIRQEEQIKRLKQQRETDIEQSDPENNSEKLDRRKFLKTAALGAAGIGLTGMASAFSIKSSDNLSFGPLSGGSSLDVDGSGNITANSIDVGQGQINSFTGNNLSIDSNGKLNAVGGSGHSVSDGGSQVVSGPSDVNFGTNLDVADDGDGTVTVNASGSSGSLNDGSIVPAPGDVQSAIDQAASNGGGIVRLDPTQRYEQDSSFPWHVKSDVILDFNGAILYGSGNHPDTDMIHVYPQAQVFNPKIDLWEEWNAYASSNPYNARVFTLDSKYGAYFADGTTIKGGWTMAVESTGTWMYLGKNNSDSEAVNHLTSITIETNLRKANEPANVGKKVIDRGIHFDSSGPSGYLNSIVFRGIIRNAKTAIYQTGSEPNNEHIIDAVIQPYDGADYIWHIDTNTFARGTVLSGKLWDLHRLGTGVAWLIDSSYGEGSGGGNQKCYQNAINARTMKVDMVENNSPFDHYVTDPAIHNTTTV